MSSFNYVVDGGELSVAGDGQQCSKYGLHDKHCSTNMVTAIVLSWDL